MKKTTLAAMIIAALTITQVYAQTSPTSPQQQTTSDTGRSNTGNGNTLQVDTSRTSVGGQQRQNRQSDTQVRTDTTASSMGTSGDTRSGKQKKAKRSKKSGSNGTPENQ